MSTPWYLDPLGQGYSPTGHTGVDVETPTGTPLTALLPGKIIDASHQPWGYQVVEQINLPGVGVVDEVLAHLDSLFVTTGQSVAAGQVLGLSGGEGLPAQYSNGPHTHIGLYTGPVWQNSDPATGAIETVNPLRLLDLFRGSASQGGQQGGASTGTTLASTGGTTLGLSNPLDAIGAEFAKINSGIVDWLKRAGFIAVGGALLLMGVAVLLMSPDNVKQAAGIAALAAK